MKGSSAGLNDSAGEMPTELGAIAAANSKSLEEMSTAVGSPRLRLYLSDLGRVADEALVVVAGALATWIVSKIGSLDLTSSEGICIAAAGTVAANLLRKFVTDSTK